MSETNEMIDREYVGPRRTIAVSPEVIPDQNTSTVALATDVLLDVSTGTGRIMRTAGKSTQEGNAPPRILGLSASRRTNDGYLSPMEQASARLLAYASTTSEQSVNTVRSLFRLDTGGFDGTGGAITHENSLHKTVVNALVFENSYPYDNGADTLYNLFHIGAVSASHHKHGRKITSTNLLQIGGSVTVKRDKLRATELIPYYSLGVSGDGTPVRTGCVAKDLGEDHGDPESPSGLVNCVSDHQKQSLDDLCMRMIMSPDEYLARNAETIKTLMSRMALYQANDFVGAFQKGFRSSFWTRHSDEELRILGEMIHVGMSLRLCQPVRNIHASATHDTMGIMIDNDSDAETEDPEGGSDESSDSSPETPIASAAGTAAADIESMIHFNMSKSPFWVYFEDLQYDGGTGDQSGFWACDPSVPATLTPGLYKPENYSSTSRDITFEDFLHGLKWTFDNSGEAMGMSWAAVGRHIRENWSDFKAGDIIDLFAESSKTDNEALRAAWNLGISTTTHFMDGGEPDAANSVLAQETYYDAGFLNLQKKDEFKREVEDLARRNWSVGPRFMAGLQNGGKSDMTVYHKTTDDGKEHYVDVSVRPHALGNWSLISPHCSIKLDGMSGTGTHITWIMDLADAEGLSGDNGLISMFDTAQVPTGAYLWHATNIHSIVNALFPANNVIDKGVCGDLAYVFRYKPGNLSEPLYWGDFTLDISSDRIDKAGRISGTQNATNLAKGRTIGYAEDGLTPINPDMSKDGLGNMLLPTELYSLKTTSSFYRWLNQLESVNRMIEKSKNITPYKTEFPGISFEGINLVGLLTFDTGDPALQQLATSLFSLSSCGSSGGWSVAHRAQLDRKVWDHGTHGYQAHRQSALVDYTAFVLPRDLDSSSVLTLMAVSNIIADKLGLLGERSVRESAVHYELGYKALRTIYRNKVLFNGLVTEHAITLGTQGYDFAGDLVDVIASLAPASQANCQPGIAFYNRLFQDPTGAGLITHGGRSFCNLLGTSGTASASGSSVGGLSGYADHIDDTVLEALGIPNYDDSSTYEDPNNAGVFLPSKKFDPSLIRQMIEVNRGNNNLYYKESGLRILAIDQDIFDKSTANLSALLSRTQGKMILGPTAFAVVYDLNGEVVWSAREGTYSIVGSGESVASAPAPSAYAETAAGTTLISESEGPTSD